MEPGTKLLNELVRKTAKTLYRGALINPDRKLSISGSSELYTYAEMGEEVEDETEIGIKFLSDMCVFTLGLYTRELSLFIQHNNQK